MEDEPVDVMNYDEDAQQRLQASSRTSSQNVTPTIPQRVIGGDVNESGDHVAPPRQPQVPLSSYVSANCMVVTYFNGDSESQVDDHFTKSLKLPNLQIEQQKAESQQQLQLQQKHLVNPTAQGSRESGEF